MRTTLSGNFSSMRRSVGIIWMQLMQPSVQKSRITTRPRRLSIGIGAATLNHSSPGRAISGAFIFAKLRFWPSTLVRAATKKKPALIANRHRRRELGSLIQFEADEPVASCWLASSDERAHEHAV